jgi:predicted O-methyltransferase YrrM
MVGVHNRELAAAIVAAERLGPLTRDSRLTGFSGQRVIAALQRLARRQHDAGEGTYLEVGVFQGLTLLSVASTTREQTVYGVDNFAQFDPDQRNVEIVRSRARAMELTNASLIDADYEDALETLGARLENRKLGVYFVDGPHDYRSQLMCLLLAVPYLSPHAVIVVDDANYRHVRLANRDFLATHPEFTLLFEAYTPCHPTNMSSAQRADAEAGWWNGVNIIVRDPAHELRRTFPPTIRTRALYEHEHEVHAERFGLLAPELVRLLTHTLAMRPRRVASLMKNLVGKLRRLPDESRRAFDHLNTYSDELSPRSFNLALDASDLA